MTTTAMDVEACRPLQQKNRKRRVWGGRWETKAVETENGDIHDDFCCILDDRKSNDGWNASISSRLCSLDIVAWKDCVDQQQNLRLQNQRRRLGETLIRKRAFECQDKRGELVYRKRESFSNPAYTKCAFLDPYDKVLAVDCNGSMDVVSLSDHRSMACNETVQRNAQNAKESVAQLELDHVIPINDFSTTFIRPLAVGSTIAVGTRDDSFYLLDMERTSSLVENLSNVLTPITTTRPHIRAWQARCPKRYYYRDRYNPLLALHRLVRNPFGSSNSGSFADISELQAIQYNGSSGRIHNHIRFVPHAQPSNDARWDVFEVHRCSSKLLHVAHVDSDYDAFWMKVLDQRASNSPSIFVDSSSQDNPGSQEEHITSIACLSDVCLATAHISCLNFGLTKARDFFDRDLAYAGHGMGTCVKLWDMRMMSSSISVKPKAANVVSLPAFPQEGTVAMEPAECIPSYLTPKGSLAMSKLIERSEDPSPKISGGSDHVITNLAALGGSSCRGNNGSSNLGSLVVTVQSRSRSTIVAHHKLDLGTRQVTRMVSQTNQSLGCHPIYAIASSQEFMVCCSQAGAGWSLPTRLDIHNLNKEANNSPSPRNSRGKKRLVDTSCSYHIEPILLDRYGVETSLSCVAMNHNGTSILGGSSDGDLFVWRGL